jgi:hypothetical protein
VRVVGAALFIKFEEADGETEMALGAASGAAAKARVAGSGYRATAATLGPTMQALSTSTGLGFVHFGALAGVGKGQRARTACKCFTKCRLWLIIKSTSNTHSAGNADLCTRLSELKVAVAPAAAELLRFAGESVDGVMLLNGYDRSP